MKEKSIFKILDDYNKYLSHVKNFSNRTIVNYIGTLKLFLNFIKKYKNVEQIDINILLNINSSDIYTFLIYLNIYRKNSAKSRQKKLSTIKCFYKWLLNCNCKIVKNPAENISIIQAHYKEAKCLTLREAKKITNIFTIKNNEMYIRDNTIISIFLNCGLRISEMVSLNISNVDLENKTFLVLGKGNIERIVPFNKNVENNILEYLRTKPIRYNLLDGECPLFITKNYKRVSTKLVATICKKAFSLAGLEGRGYTTHSLRHTAATLIYLYGNSDIRVIQEILGHGSIEATQLYVHPDKKRIKKSFLSNPLGKVRIKEKRKGENNSMENYNNNVNEKYPKDFNTDTIRENNLKLIDVEYDLILKALYVYIKIHKMVYSNINTYDPLGEKLRLDLLQDLYNKISNQYDKSVRENPIIHIENAKYDLYNRIDKRVYYKTKKYYKNKK